MLPVVSVVDGCEFADEVLRGVSVVDGREFADEVLPVDSRVD